jgi:hypothetical protein
MNRGAQIRPPTWQERIDERPGHADRKTAGVLPGAKRLATGTPFEDTGKGEPVRTASAGARAGCWEPHSGALRRGAKVPLILLAARPARQKEDFRRQIDVLIPKAAMAQTEYEQQLKSLLGARPRAPWTSKRMRLCLTWVFKWPTFFGVFSASRRLGGWPRRCLRHRKAVAQPGAAAGARPARVATPRLTSAIRIFVPKALGPRALGQQFRTAVARPMATPLPPALGPP